MERKTYTYGKNHLLRIRTDAAQATDEDEEKIRQEIKSILTGILEEFTARR